MSLLQSLKACVVLMWTINCVLCLKIGSFNIQIFGDSKSKKADVMNVIGKIIVQYDIIFIMEIRDSKKKAIPRLMKTVQEHSQHEYNLVISDRVGRTSSKEQYAFLYRNDIGLEVIEDFLYDDGDEEKGNDVFEREPYIVHFKSSNTVVDEFVFIGIHVDPDEAVDEINGLADVIGYTKRKMRIDNIIVLGDLNADCSYVSKKKMKTIALRHRSDVYWPIGDDVDTTAGKTECAYDRFILMGEELINSIVPNSVGVFDFQEAYGLSREKALKVSDHYPIEMRIRNKKDVNEGNKKHDFRLVVLVTMMCLPLLV